jgi:hypothetical protein
MTTLQVIGAGWGRTGTTSTLAALEELGFGPCYTFYTIMSQKPEHFERWIAAYAGERMDWPALCTGFNSVVDWPACDFYPQLLELWPEAKIILNIRDPEGWYKSMTDTLWSVAQMLRQGGQTPETNPLLRLVNVMMWDGTFHGRFEDKAYAIDLFESNIRRVQASLPPEKLLVFDVKEGWEPMCRFLDRPVPDKPFPRLNDTESFHERARQSMAH